MADEVLTRVEAGIATVTLNRPEKRNAMNAALLGALRDGFDELKARREVRVVVVRGAGPVFCAGMDLREMEARQGAETDPESGVIQVLQRIERSRHPTIAMVHGDALAGGCELALHCDLRVAADGARFGMPLARIGLVVPFPLGQNE
jgi:enoyl-CoA hydratase/carnithine racemase